MKIGFIGLGNVGGKLAGSLHRNKFDLTVYDLDGAITSQFKSKGVKIAKSTGCLLYTSPSPRDRTRSRMPSSA